MDWLKKMLDEAWVEVRAREIWSMMGKPANPSESTRFGGEMGDGGSIYGDGEEEDRNIG
jgi:hypothetical protein